MDDQVVHIPVALWERTVKALENMVDAYDDPDDRPSMVIEAMETIVEIKQFEK